MGVIRRRKRIHPIDEKNEVRLLGGAWRKIRPRCEIVPARVVMCDGVGEMRERLKFREARVPGYAVFARAFPVEFTQ